MRRLMILGLLCVASCGQPQEAAQPAAKHSSPASIAPDVMVPYDRATYPKTFAKWGEAAVTGQIQKLREDAAKAVAVSPDCDAVMLSELSDRSSPPDDPEVFVDCNNGNRWRYRGDEPVEPKDPDQLSVYGN
ncbi:hypothetical protein [Brevundimonas vesicularis]|uniref:hypothetical protein n=1 Tax=Brevundimonas vesicularis TaxID=41276 RepID=UPI0011B0BC3D|nr:hypothetical protein [Brevundimonas vesicularis]